MMIKINLGSNLFPPQSFVRVDYYKTQYAYNYPLEHEGEIFHCATEINKDMSIQDILNIIEISVNMLLKK